MIVGRSVEQSRINRVVADAKGGRSRSLVLRGEAGTGKTALLDYAESVAGGMRVLRVVGIESEAEVAYAALQLMFVRDLHLLEPCTSTRPTPGEWLARREPDMVVLERTHTKADVAVCCPAADLLLVLSRRRPLDAAPALELHGDRALLERWLEHMDWVTD